MTSTVTPENMNKQSDATKLRFLAEWFDEMDKASGNPDDEVQKDLRRIADRLEELDSPDNFVSVHPLDINDAKRD